MKWYYQIGRQVWPYEIGNFLFRDRRLRHGPTLAEFWGPLESCDGPESSCTHAVTRWSQPASVS
jgi:anaerobic magnesium-protoporphyrin IX monomethyl ester cyclase